MNRFAELESLLARLEQLGCTASVQISIAVPLPPTEVAPAAPELPVKGVATIKTTLWALNRLLGAPGQPNRNLVRKFLWHRGWIAGAEEPESWKLEHVPTTKPELAELINRIAQFEKDAKAPAAPATPTTEEADLL